MAIGGGDEDEGRIGRDNYMLGTSSHACSTSVRCGVIWQTYSALAGIIDTAQPLGTPANTRRDADGWCTYARCGDDMLQVGGIYVSPIEVEEAQASHVDVLEAAVIGAPDADELIKPKAFVVMQVGKAGDEDALKAHVKPIFALYKYPRLISFVDELPKTVTGKIQRFQLRTAL